MVVGRLEPADISAVAELFTETVHSVNFTNQLVRRPVQSYPPAV